MDTKEQQPLNFHSFDFIETCHDHLPAGDYTIVGHDMVTDDHSVIIERKKNVQELVNNIGAEWDRFISEAEILKQYKHKSIIVCGPNNIDYLYSRGFTKISPGFFYKQLSILQIEYGLPTIFAGDRESAEHYMVRYFNHIVRLHKQDE